LEDLVAERTVELSREITTRKEHGATLRKSEERFRNFTEMAADRYWETGKNHIIAYAPILSERIKELGIEVLGKKPWGTEVELPADQKEFLFEKFESKKEFEYLNICWRLPSSEEFHRRLSGMTMRDGKGKFIGFRVIGITDFGDDTAGEKTEFENLAFHK
tara:strand:- start:53 stop:535 length:483 start_codon:yes stop_codon:yes gene_type:complete